MAYRFYDFLTAVCCGTSRFYMATRARRMLYNPDMNRCTINLRNSAFVFYMSIFFAHFAISTWQYLIGAKVDIISFSTNKKCKKNKLYTV